MKNHHSILEEERSVQGSSGVRVELYRNKPHKDVFISHSGLERERVWDVCLMEWTQPCVSMLTALALSYPGKESAVGDCSTPSVGSSLAAMVTCQFKPAQRMLNVKPGGTACLCLDKWPWSILFSGLVLLEGLYLSKVLLNGIDLVSALNRPGGTTVEMYSFDHHTHQKAA